MMIQKVVDEHSFGNNVVSQSDYQAALEALAETFQNIDETDPIARDLYQATHDSLVENLARVVQPVENSAYHAWIDPYHVVEDESDDDDEEQEQEATEEQEEDVGEQPDGQEIDEEDLLDINASQKAQQLRSQVRTLSERIQLIRERVLKKAEASFEPLQPDDPVQVQEMGEAEAEGSDDFVSSLEELSKLLNHSQWAKLPQHLQSLQDTIEVIQKENSQPLSKIESAIISRSNSEEEGHPLSSQEDQDLSAPDRLLRFFQDMA